jgi:hypothetical protein
LFCQWKPLDFFPLIFSDHQSTSASPGRILHLLIFETGLYFRNKI